MVAIADTSALLAWPPERVSSALAVPSQMAEVEKFSPERALLYQAQGPQWAQPSTESIAAARSAAATTGDLPGLSGVDIELLALTIEKNGVLLSDDYRLLNVATSAGIEWRAGGQSGIIAGWDWELRCTGCRRRTSTAAGETGEQQASECDICGSPLVLKRKRR